MLFLSGWQIGEVMSKYSDSVADMFIKAMGEGTAPWQRPWESSPFSLINGVTGHEYSGMNVILLSMNPYNDLRYCTFKQANEAGYKIKKGSKGHLIKYCCFLTIDDEEEGEEIEEKKIFMQKRFYVFNFEQMEGVPELEIKEADKEFNPIQRCEEVLKNFDLEIEESITSNRAFYSVNKDKIFVPNRERFVDELSFYHTVFHEMAHATGASQRLNRDFGPFTSSAYAFEELVAEITSFLVGRSLGCGSEPREESVNYVASWIEQVKKDSNVLFKACKLAEEASKWILNPTERK